MRICLVSQEYPPETGHGGIATQTHLKAHGLATLGHEVVVVSHGVDRCRSESAADGVRVVRLPGPDVRMEVRTDAVRWLEWSTDVAAEIDALHAAAPLDLVEVPDWGGEGFVHVLNRVDSSPRVVVHLHGTVAMLTRGLGWPEPGSDLHRVGTMLEGTCIRRADAVYSSSRMSAEWCAHDYGIEAASIPVLHSGVPLPAVDPRDSNTRPTVVFVGKVGPSKGADVLAKAACIVARDVPDLRLRVWGPSVGDWAQRILAMAAEAGFPDLVEILGVLPRESFDAEVGAADVFASPSPFEAGPGLVFLEAMALGVPVVGCADTGISDVVRHGDNGLLVPRGDVDALADALRTLIVDRRTREDMGRRARIFVEQEADTRTCVPKIAEFYASVLAGVR